MPHLNTMNITYNIEIFLFWAFKSSNIELQISISKCNISSFTTFVNSLAVQKYHLWGNCRRNNYNNYNILYLFRF